MSKSFDDILNNLPVGLWEEPEKDNRVDFAGPTPDDKGARLGAAFPDIFGEAMRSDKVSGDDSEDNEDASNQDAVEETKSEQEYEEPDYEPPAVENDVTSEIPGGEADTGIDIGETAILPEINIEQAKITVSVPTEEQDENNLTTENNSMGEATTDIDFPATDLESSDYSVMETSPVSEIDNFEDVPVYKDDSFSAEIEASDFEDIPENDSGEIGGDINSFAPDDAILETDSVMKGAAETSDSIYGGTDMTDEVVSSLW